MNTQVKKLVQDWVIWLADHGTAAFVEWSTNKNVCTVATILLVKLGLLWSKPLSCKYKCHN